jgi:hypothetical protein
MTQFVSRQRSLKMVYSTHASRTAHSHSTSGRGNLAREEAEGAGAAFQRGRCAAATLAAETNLLLGRGSLRSRVPAAADEATAAWNNFSLLLYALTKPTPTTTCGSTTGFGGCISRCIPLTILSTASVNRLAHASSQWRGRGGTLFCALLQRSLNAA